MGDKREGLNPSWRGSGRTLAKANYLAILTGRVFENLDEMAVCFDLSGCWQRVMKKSGGFPLIARVSRFRVISL
tara:strand:- start:19 stop:240 length:222 start_codon:yes stop_codon:yes gene_type:complete